MSKKSRIFARFFSATENNDNDNYNDNAMTRFQYVCIVCLVVWGEVISLQAAPPTTKQQIRALEEAVLDMDDKQTVLIKAVMQIGKDLSDLQQQVDSQLTELNVRQQELTLREMELNHRQQKIEMLELELQQQHDTLLYRTHPRYYLQRYFDYGGMHYLGIFGAGYTYSTAGNAHLVSASLMDMRFTLVGISPLAVEMMVEPYRKQVAYTPSIRVFVPLGRCWSLVPYGGVAMDANGVGKWFKKSMDYDFERDFYMTAIAGVGIQYATPKVATVEVRVEYRHDLPQFNSSPIYDKGIYLTARFDLGFALPFRGY